MLSGCYLCVVHSLPFYTQSDCLFPVHFHTLYDYTELILLCQGDLALFSEQFRHRFSPLFWGQE